MRAIYLLHVLPEQTRVEVIKPMIDARKEKLPDLPRQKIVECWREEDAPRIAA
jgi:hypothetical protein